MGACRPWAVFGLDLCPRHPGAFSPSINWPWGPPGEAEVRAEEGATRWPAPNVSGPGSRPPGGAGPRPPAGGSASPVCTPRATWADWRGRSRSGPVTRSPLPPCPPAAPQAAASGRGAPEASCAPRPSVSVSVSLPGACDAASHPRCSKRCTKRRCPLSLGGTRLFPPAHPAPSTEGTVKGFGVDLPDTSCHVDQTFGI